PVAEVEDETAEVDDMADEVKPVGVVDDEAEEPKVAAVEEPEAAPEPAHEDDRSGHDRTDTWRRPGPAAPVAAAATWVAREPAGASPAASGAPAQNGNAA